MYPTTATISMLTYTFTNGYQPTLIFFGGGVRLGTEAWASPLLLLLLTRTYHLSKRPLSLWTAKLPSCVLSGLPEHRPTMPLRPAHAPTGGGEESHHPRLPLLYSHRHHLLHRTRVRILLRKVRPRGREATECATHC